MYPRQEGGMERILHPSGTHHTSGGQSTGQFRDRMFVALWRSRFRLFEKHYSRAYTAAVRLILKAGLARRARQVRLALAAGAIDQEAADKQLYAYRTVLEL